VNHFTPPVTQLSGNIEPTHCAATQNGAFVFPAVSCSIIGVYLNV